MEVHEHPHHVTHSKKWSEYVLEFLMLFLAVFLGFLAESYREQLVEREREKEYMHAMLADLRLDSLRCANNISKNEVLKKVRDSLTQFAFSAKKMTAKDIKQLYYFNKKNTDIVVIPYKERTLDQLKNAGGYRLIKHQNVSDSILNYGQGIAWQKGLNDNFTYLRREFNNTIDQIFDQSSITKYSSAEALLQSNETFTLLDDNRKTLLGYGNKLVRRDFAINSIVMEQKLQFNRCLRLIHLIKKEYHLEEE